LSTALSRGSYSARCLTFTVALCSVSPMVSCKEASGGRKKKPPVGLCRRLFKERAPRALPRSSERERPGLKRKATNVYIFIIRFLSAWSLSAGMFCGTANAFPLCLQRLFLAKFSESQFW
jgi:hypothetical protein